MIEIFHRAAVIILLCHFSYQPISCYKIGSNNIRQESRRLRERRVQIADHFRGRQKPLHVLEDDRDYTTPEIDPLEQTKVSKNIQSKSRRSQKSIEYQRRESITSDIESIKRVQNIPQKELDEDLMKSINEKITRKQAEILTTLPLDYFLWFRSVAEQMLPITSLITVTAHIIILLPALQILKSQYDVKIIPFLYLTPLLLIAPYVAYWLWENDVTTVPLIDKKLRDWAAGQRDNSKIALDEQTNVLMTRVVDGSDSAAAEAIKKLAQLRLLADIDVDKFIDEVIAIKKKVKGIKDPSILSTYVQSPSAQVSRDARVNARSGAARVNEVNSAVKALIETSLVENNEDPKSLLEKLKQLEKDLEGDTRKEQNYK